MLDIRLPGRSGLELIDALARGGAAPSVVFISGHVDVPIAVRAMNAGAVDVLTEPVREQDLLEAVNRAIARNERRRGDASRIEARRVRCAALTERERQVVALVTDGLPNKQIAARPPARARPCRRHAFAPVRLRPTCGAPPRV